MHHIPTRLDGVVLSTDPRVSQDDSEQQIEHGGVASRFPFDEMYRDDFGFTEELSYSCKADTHRTIDCTEGDVYVVAADIRYGSPTFGHWQAFHLRGEDHRAVYLPAGVAVGWQVQSETASVRVTCSQDVSHDSWSWLCWNDLDLSIAWPELPELIGAHRLPSIPLNEIPQDHLPQYSIELADVPEEVAEGVQAERIDGRQSVTTGKDALSAVNESLYANESLQDVEDDSDFLRIRTMDSTKSKPHAVSRIEPAIRPAAAKNSGELSILVLGSTGQLGRDLCRQLRRVGKVIGACRKPSRSNGLPIPLEVNVGRPASIRQAIRMVKPDIIVNASGMTDLELAERQPRLAQMINATAPALIAEEAQRVGAGVVHFCSEMVFGQAGERPWRECDEAIPVNQYSRTKLLGTRAVVESGVPHLILRSGWLYSQQGENFVTRLVDLLTYRNTVTLAADHYGTPTSTRWLADLVAQLLQRGRGNPVQWMQESGGLFHAAPLGYANRVEVGDQIMATCRNHGLPIVTGRLLSEKLASQSKTLVIPNNCRLDCSKLGLHFQVDFPRWQQELEERLSDMLTSGLQVDRVVA